jgi:hypothetical protein
MHTSLEVAGAAYDSFDGQHRSVGQSGTMAGMGLKPTSSTQADAAPQPYQTGLSPIAQQIRE